MPSPEGDYPEQRIEVLSVEEAFNAVFARPRGVIEWPPTQVSYLRQYVGKLGCRSAVVEHHYVDRDYIHDVAMLYARNLRGYPNYCRRMHLFRADLDAARWRTLVLEARDPAARVRAEAELGEGYLGFVVVRPLPAAPVGRTVLRTYGPSDSEGNGREFPAIRDYEVHLGPFALRVAGLAFQQQDGGVSACATTALWSALHGAAPLEGLAIRTPAEITEAASRYVLAGGRPLPSEGLTVHQVCEAIREAGLSPLLVRPGKPEQDIGQIAGYLQSGFPVVLGLKDIGAGTDGHAVCVVGTKLGPVRPQSNPDLHHADGASRVASLFLHDDRLGPYAVADIHPWTEEPARPGQDAKVVTGLWIKWPDTTTEAKHCVLTAIVVPVPIKLRLTIGRVREWALPLAELAGERLTDADGHALFNCRFESAARYRQRLLSFGLSDEGLYALTCATVLSRYVGVIEVCSREGTPLFDLLLDSTEIDPPLALLGWVCRSGLGADGRAWLARLSKGLGGKLYQ